MRRTLAFLPLVGLLCTIAVVAGQREAAATTVQTGYTWNVCGGDCFANSISEPRNRLKAYYDAQSTEPLFISLNEVCYDQYYDASLGLRQWLIGEGYVTYNYEEDLDRGNCGNDPILNVIGVRGAFVSHIHDDLPTQPPSPVGIVNGYACVKTTGFVVLAACSTHLTTSTSQDPNNPGTRTYQQTQSDEMIFIAGLLYPNSIRTLAGDWNIRPQQKYLDQSARTLEVYYSNYVEAAGYLSNDSGHFTQGQPYPSLTRKVDYFWFQQPYFAANPLPTEIWDLGVSDHRLLIGRVFFL